MQEKNFFHLTNPQKSIWVTEEYYKGSAINNICGTALIKEKVNLRLLEKAIRTTLQNNDIFKIKFSMHDNEVMQYVSDYVNSDIIYLRAKNNLELQKTLDEIVAIPFHLLDSYPYNFYIITFPNGNAAFCLNIHHILADSWTLGFLSRQVIKTYCAYLLIDIPYEYQTYSYINFIQSEEKYKQSKRFLKDQLYWNKEFETIPDIPFIPGSVKDSSQIENTSAQRSTFRLNSSLVTKIKSYCSTNNISLFNFFMAIYSIYIQNITNLNDFVIGTPILNRTNNKEKNTAGMFINMAPFRVNFSGITTFKDFIKYISSKSVSMLKHQKYSYQSLIEDLRKVHGNIPPLYNTVFSYQITNTQSKEIFVKNETSWTFNKNSAENLTFQIYNLDNKDFLDLCYDYKTSIYTSDDIRNINKRIISLINQVISTTNIDLKDLDILSSKEKRLILNKFNNTKAIYDKSTTLIDLFEKIAKRNPNNIAIIHNSTEYSYATINNMANIIADKIGDIKGKKIAVLCEKSALTVASFLGIMKSGNCYIPIDMEYPKERIKYILENSEASILISNSENNITKDFKNKIILDKLDYSQKITYKNKAKPANYAYIIYTSGTTGNPKGVLIKHKNIINTLLWRKNLYKFNKNTSVFQIPSFSFDSSVEDIFTPLISGGKLILPSTQKIDINKMCEDIKKYNVNNFLVVPSLYKILLKEKYEYLKNMKIVTIAGEDFNTLLVKEHFEKLPNVRLINEYGPTENSVCSTYYELKPNNKDIYIGKPISNCKCYCLNDNLKPYPVGVPGELYVSGPGVSEGYLNKPEITEERFIDNPFGGKFKLYKTGDLVEYNSDGNIKFIGRNDNQIKLHGFRIELKEIEQVILKNSNILDVLVTKKIDSNNKPILVAYIITSKKNYDTNILRKDLQEVLPQYMVPQIVKIEKFPLTPNGKIDVKSLPLPKVICSNNMQPTSSLEKKMLNIFKDILNNSKLEVSDNFFDFGGADSLDILSVNSRFFTQGIILNTQDFYKYPSVRELASYYLNQKKDISDVEEEIIKPRKTIFPVDINVKDLHFSYQNILLTGSTGFLGVHILDYIIKHTKSNIYCIVRKTRNTASEKRLENILTYYFSKDYYKSNKNRIIVIEGDLSKDKFGLSEKKYTFLQNTIDCIINTASNTKHYGSLYTFKKANIDSVENLIKFAKPVKILLNHISTTTVSGNYLVNNDLSYKYTENDLYIGQDYKSNVYVYSKFEAERLIIEEEKNGLIANIFRLGNLMARYSDGCFQKNKLDNAYYTRLIALTKFGYLPNNLKNEKLEFTPIDDASKAIVKLLEIPNLKNNIFHIFSDKLITIDVLLKVIQNYGYECKFIDYNKFIDKFYLQKNEKILKYIISDLNSTKKFDYSSNIIIDQTLTNEFLKLVSFEWSEIDYNYLKRFFDKTNFKKDVDL
ncbi:MAG: amino acid adenylation domain-containing protein [Clostridia bacterium]|nr:amino acid adenylation domain-containing protein [Clostridia bacterium]